MNLQQFIELHKNLKNADQITIECDNGDKCVHPDQPNITIGKGAAIKNYRKHGDEKFICRKCDMKYANPMTKVGQGLRSKDKLAQYVPVICLGCQKARPMKLACYTGDVSKEPYIQTCGTCAQKGRTISEEHKEAIRSKLAGVKKSEEFKRRLSEYMKNNPEGIERGKKNLVPGMGGIKRKGIPLPPEWKKAISDAVTGVPKSVEHCHNISSGRKKMLKAMGGFTLGHREKLSLAQTLNARRGFKAETYHLKGYHHSPKVNKTFFHMSSYEKRAFMLLDSDPQVQSYEYEVWKIRFWHRIKQNYSWYRIDLRVHYTDGSVKEVEIKPAKWLVSNNQHALVVQDKAKAALKAAGEEGKTYEIWSEAHLFGTVETEKKMREFTEWLRNELKGAENDNGNQPDQNP